MDFSYCGREICGNEKLVQQKRAGVAEILGIFSNTLKPAGVHKSSGLKVYNVLVLFFLRGSEIWTLRQSDKKDYMNLYDTCHKHRLTTKGMKKFWKT